MVYFIMIQLEYLIEQKFSADGFPSGGPSRRHILFLNAFSLLNGSLYHELPSWQYMSDSHQKTNQLEYSQFHLTFYVS